MDLTLSSVSSSCSSTNDNASFSSHIETSSSSSSKRRVVVVNRYSISSLGGSSSSSSLAKKKSSKKRVDLLLDLCKKYSAMCHAATARESIDDGDETTKTVIDTSLITAAAVVDPAVKSNSGVFIDMSPTRKAKSIKKDWLLDVLQNYAHKAKWYIYIHITILLIHFFVLF